ncbi:hypothetical protein AB0L63_31850 [Nocardia sp. NPDC051990]|uniref:hypothetical protein n=1 Tax=Nocardia sp. NPDC051990 TaxID=3155285 RepID=UPI00344290E2
MGASTSITVRDTMATAAQRMLDVGALPICDGERHPVDIVTQADLSAACPIPPSVNSWKPYAHNIFRYLPTKGRIARPAPRRLDRLTEDLVTEHQFPYRVDRTAAKVDRAALVVMA